MTHPAPTPPRWDVPHPYSYSAAIDGMGSISAPLLAATSTALVGLVLTLGHSTIRWNNAALLLLVGSSFAFVACVQLTFWAKRFVVTPADLADWWPQRFAENDPELEWEQRFHSARFDVWANRCRFAYNTGILLLLASLPIMLVPRGKVADMSGVRLATVAVAIAAFAAEAVWIWLASQTPTRFDPIDSVD